MRKVLHNSVQLLKNTDGIYHLVKLQKSGEQVALSVHNSYKNLLLDEYFVEITKKYQQAVREVVAIAVQAGVPVPTFSSAIAYYDSYRSDRLPANLIQAQRDYFGAHTYERTDKEGIYHYSWYNEE